MNFTDPEEVSDRQPAAMVVVPTAGGFREFLDVWISVDDEISQLYIWESEEATKPRSVVPYSMAQITW